MKKVRREFRKQTLRMSLTEALSRVIKAIDKSNFELEARVETADRILYELGFDLSIEAGNKR